MAKAKAGTVAALLEQYTAPDFQSNATFKLANALMNFYNWLNVPELKVEKLIILPVTAGGEILTWDLARTWSFPEDQFLYFGLQRNTDLIEGDDEDFKNTEIVGLSIKLAATQTDPFEKLYNLAASRIPGVTRETVIGWLAQTPTVKAAVDAALSKNLPF
jgi:hypothetical protein